MSYKWGAWQKAVDSKGFFAIASSDEMSAEEIYRLYQLRDASETQFAIFKSELGMDALGVHTDASIETSLPSPLWRASSGPRSCGPAGVSTETPIR